MSGSGWVSGIMWPAPSINVTLDGARQGDRAGPRRRGIAVHFPFIPACCVTPAGSSSPTTATTLAPSVVLPSPRAVWAPDGTCYPARAARVFSGPAGTFQRDRSSG